MEDNAENAINQAITQVQTNGYRKTFTMGNIKTDDTGDTFTLIKKGPVVEISAWISPSTLSKPLSGWKWDDSFKSSIVLPNPLMVTAYPFIPDSYTNINSIRYFQIHNGYLYLYNRSNSQITNIAQGGLHIVYLTDEI